VTRICRKQKLTVFRFREDVGRLEAEQAGIAIAGTDLQDQLLTSRLQNFEARRGCCHSRSDRQLAVTNEAKVRLSRLQENLANAKPTSLMPKLTW